MTMRNSKAPDLPRVVLGTVPIQENYSSGLVLSYTGLFHRMVLRRSYGQVLMNTHTTVSVVFVVRTVMNSKDFFIFEGMNSTTYLARVFSKNWIR